MGIYLLLTLGVLLTGASSEENVLGFPVLDITLPNAPPGPCMDQAQIIARHLNNNTLWASQMWDASAKGTAGVLKGSSWDLGSFEECLGVEGPLEPQYCLVQVQLLLDDVRNSSTVQYMRHTIADSRLLRRDVHRFGVCVPSVCTAEDLQKAFTSQIQQMNLSLSYNVTVQQSLCTVNESVPLSINEILIIIFLVILGSVTAVGTLSYSGPGSSLTKYFSLADNFRSLMRIEKADPNDPLLVLHGIKVISMIMIVFSHKMLIIAEGFIFNFETAVEDKFKNFALLLIGSYLDMLVDTFFFFSAVIITMVTCSKWNNKRSIWSLGLPVISRVIRLAPAYYGLVWLTTSGMMNRIGQGPIWNHVNNVEQEVCQQSWWANLLFIHNYIPLEKQCTLHSWYLACDVQFFIVAMLLLPMLISRPTLGKWVLGVATIVASIAPSINSYVYSVHPLLLFTAEAFSHRREQVFFTYIYFPAHLRITTYFIGIGVGLFMHRKAASKYKLPTIWTVIYAAIAMTCFFIVSSIGTMYYSDSIPSSEFGAFYIWFRRPVWVAGVAIFLLTHRFSHPNVISRMLSCDPIIVLSKLSYTMYIVHWPLLVVYHCITRVPPYYTMIGMIKDFGGDMCYTLVLSLAVYLVVEQPVKKFLNHLLFKRVSSDD